MMRALNRRYVTLLELIVVIAIVAMVSGVVAISVNKALVEQRFRSEVGRIVDELRLAQDLMLVLGRDVHVRFAELKDNKGNEYWIDHETALSGYIQKELSGRKRPLVTIKGVRFGDEAHKEPGEEQIDVKFFSNGAVMSKGIMRLATTDKEPLPEGALQAYICLPGYPMPIAQSETYEAAAARCQVDGVEDSEALTRDTLQRLPEKLKKKEEARGGPVQERAEEGEADKEKKGSPKTKSGKK